MLNINLQHCPKPRSRAHARRIDLSPTFHKTLKHDIMTIVIFMDYRYRRTCLFNIKLHVSKLRYKDYVSENLSFIPTFYKIIQAR